MRNRLWSQTDLGLNLVPPHPRKTHSKPYQEHYTFNINPSKSQCPLLANGDPIIYPELIY